MIRTRTNGDVSPATDQGASSSTSRPDGPAGLLDAAPLHAYAIRAGRRVLLFGTLASNGTTQPESSPPSRRRKRLSQDPSGPPATLRVQLAPRRRWRPIDLQPDGSWQLILDLSTLRLPRQGRTVRYQLLSPQGTVEQSIPLWHWPSSITRAVVCSMEVVHAEALRLRSRRGSSTQRALRALLHRVAGRGPNLSDMVVYMGSGGVALEHEKKLLRSLHLPKGVILPAGLMPPARPGVEPATALLSALDALLPSKVRFVLLDTRDGARGLLDASPSEPALKRLDTVLLWPEANGREHRLSARGKSRRDDTDRPRVLCVEDAEEANRLLVERGLLPLAPAGTEGPVRRHRTRRRSTRYPLVLCHGLLAYSSLSLERPSLADYFQGVRRHLEEHGFTVWTPEVGKTQSVADRAGQLREAITRKTSGPVNLIGHSMGGLDARWLISRLDMAERVPLLVTLATPHHGSTFANWFLERAERRLRVLPLLEALGVDLKGYRDVTPEACRRFNEEVPDAPGVTYEAYTASTSRQRISPVLRQAYDVLRRAEGPNDGMVSVASASRGTVLGHLNTDHFCQIGHGHFQSDFDHRAFFLRLASELARRGF